jgi:hypothetical protein
MSRIGRETFVSEMGQGLDINNLSPDAQAALKKAGIDPARLAAVAGEDGVVRGQDELDALFTLMDTKDRDGSYDSIATTKKSGEATVSGQLYEALKGERERARLGGPAAPPAKPASPAPASSAASLPHAKFRPGDAGYDKGVAALKKEGFTDIHLARNTPYFNQADAPWGDDIYPKVGQKDSKRTIQEAGCAPTALAIADATLRGNDTLPSTTAKFAVDHKFSGKLNGVGSDTHPMAKAWAKEHGLVYTPAVSSDQHENVNTIRDGLKNGGVALVGVGPERGKDTGHFTDKAHVMVINGYAKDKDGAEWFFVVNPGRRDQGKDPAKVDAQVKQLDTLHHGAGQVRISRDQLEKELRHGLVLSKPTK